MAREWAQALGKKSMRIPKHDAKSPSQLEKRCLIVNERRRLVGVGPTSSQNKRSRGKLELRSSSRKLVERFSNPFSSSPEPSSFTAHPPYQVRPSSSSRCSRGELPRGYHVSDPGMRQLRPIDADAKLFPPRAAAFPPLPGQPVRRSRRRLVAPFARPASTSGPPPSAGSPAPPVLVMARSTRSSVSSLARSLPSTRPVAARPAWAGKIVSLG